MNPRRFAQVTTALCGTVGLAGWVVASLTGVGSVGIENAGAVSIEDHTSRFLIAEVVDAVQVVYGAIPKKIFKSNPEYWLKR